MCDLNDARHDIRAGMQNDGEEQAALGIVEDDRIYNGETGD